MAQNGDLCFACRRLIDEPWTEKPHAALETFDTPKVVVADFNTRFYECRICGATLRRIEGESPGEVAWGRVA